MGVKISVGLGMTISVPGTDKYTNIKPSVEFSDIDIDEPIAPQLEKARAAALETAEVVERTLGQILSDASGLAVEGIGVVTQIKEMADKVEKIATVVRQHHAQLKGATPIGQ